jgi:hypothetical protein
LRTVQHRRANHLLRSFQMIFPSPPTLSMSDLDPQLPIQIPQLPGRPGTGSGEVFEEFQNHAMSLSLVTATSFEVADVTRSPLQVLSTVGCNLQFSTYTKAEELTTNLTN